MIAARGGLFLLLVATPLAAQGRALRGRVVDAAGGAPLPGARLVMVRGAGRATTDDDGRFRITGEAGDTLRVLRIGYAEWRVAFSDVHDGDLVTLRAAATTLPDLVAVAGPGDRRAADVVLPVTRLSRDEIRTSGAASVDQLLQELPGLQQVASSPAANTLMIRGIGDGRVLVLLDGEPAPGQQLEDRDLSRLSTVATERIEVVKGPLSVIHGSQALGGVVNVVSRAPDGPLAFEATGRGGSWGRREASLSAAAGGALAWRLTGGWRQQDRISGQLERDGTMQRVWDGAGTLRTALGRLTLRADAHAFRERQRWAAGSGFYGFNDNRGVTAWTELGTTAGGGEWRLRFFGQDYSHRYRQAQSLTPIEHTGAPTQEERIGRATLSHARRVGGVHQLETGIEASSRRVVAADRLLGERLSDEMVEGYLQDGISVGRVLATVAGRMTWNSRWGTAITPSLGLAYEPSAALRVRAGAARGFRGPSFKELGWNFINAGGGYTVQGNPDLVPERSWQYFAGASWAPRRSVGLDVDLYRNELREMIEQRFVGTTPAGLQIYSPRNVARARTQGVEVALRWQDRTTSASLGYEHLDGEDLSTGLPLSRRAPHTARLRAARRFALPATPRLDLTGRWTAAAQLIDGEGAVAGEQGALVAWDLALRLELLRGTSLQFGVDNLFDTRPDGWQAAVRRAFTIGLSTAVTP